MSNGKPFWSSVPGVVTGVAGVISAIVGLLGVSTQLGWIGGDGKANTSSSANGVTTTTPATVFGAATTSPAGAVRPGEFEVEPASASFVPLQAKETTVTVRNTGDVPLTMRAPTIARSGADAFDVTDEGCTGSTLALGRSCEIKVAFTATQPGDYNAVLVVAASNAPRQVEVALKGTRSLLG